MFLDDSSLHPKRSCLERDIQSMLPKLSQQNMSLRSDRNDRYDRITIVPELNRNLGLSISTDWSNILSNLTSFQHNGISRQAFKLIDPEMLTRSSVASATGTAAMAPQPVENGDRDAAAEIAEIPHEILPEIPGEDQPAPTQVLPALLGALRAACCLAGVTFKENEAANQLSLKLLAKIDPSSLPSASLAFVLEQPVGRGGTVSAKFLKDGHNIDGKELESDPVLEYLKKTRRDACVLGSVRQDIPGPAYAVSLEAFDNAKLAAVNIGDVIQYKEPNSKELAMAIVLGIRSKRDNSSGAITLVQARRLYTHYSLLQILDSISSYRQNPKLKAVDLTATPSVELQSDDDFRRALVQRNSLKTKLQPGSSLTSLQNSDRMLC